MFNNPKDTTILILSLLLGSGVISVSCIGLFTPHFYASETLNWQAQSVGQDIVDLLFVAPCLLVSAVVAYIGSKTAKLIWGGVVLYLTYTFVLYCFDVHFNKLFLLYCAGLGMSFYLFIYFVFSEHRVPVAIMSKSLIRFIGIYFIIIAVLFYLLWLTEIAPAIARGVVPKSVSDAGLFTNGVHVIDLAIFLPGTFITGVLLLKRKPTGYLLTPVLLTFFILMDVTIGALVLVMKSRGIETNSALTIVMAVLALMSIALLTLFFRNAKINPQ